MGLEMGFLITKAAEVGAWRVLSSLWGDEAADEVLRD